VGDASGKNVSAAADGSGARTVAIPRHSSIALASRQPSLSHSKLADRWWASYRTPPTRRDDLSFIRETSLSWYSDGVTEATDRTGDEFGVGRLSAMS
jgi:hypothetical protein